MFLCGFFVELAFKKSIANFINSNSVLDCFNLFAMMIKLNLKKRWLLAQKLS